MPAEAILYEKLEGGALRCLLCAHYCRIISGRKGICGVRENRGGTLYSLVYGKVVAENVDPIEKKPLYHFQPGSLSYSIATVGCNLSCSHCQNYQISKEAVKGITIPGNPRTPEAIVSSALDTGCRSVSYTYTEPTIFMEFARDCAQLASRAGLANIFVTNGFLSPEARDVACGFLDAANIDLKAATQEHYRQVCGASLQPVLDTIEELHGRGVWIEVTTLLIPGLNDDIDSLQFIASFIASLDTSIPWHISRFFPAYKMLDRPPTPIPSMRKAEQVGRQAGLKHVYLGNVRSETEITSCGNCGHPLIERSGYSVREMRVTDAGKCPACGTAFDGVLP
ncbi:MAG: AmmeMemoRadiSam system radical SAM enzyme [bacterium]|nr:MAG: AmmeMemoRadiSam system radical SAM enzyme [bacterium]